MIHSTKMHWPFIKDHSGTGYSARNRTCPPHPLLMEPGILVTEGADSSRYTYITCGDEDRKGNVMGVVPGCGLEVKDFSR